MAILKAGAACVPLAPEHPRLRSKEMITSNVRATVLLTSRVHYAECADLVANVLVVDESTIGMLQDDGLQKVSVGTDQAAYILHTSGSTGTLKGVVLEHRNLTTSLMAYGESLTPPSTADERLLQETWASVLDIPVDKIGKETSFISLGGDSITGMQDVSRCGKRGVLLKMSDMLRSRSLLQAATHCTPHHVGAPGLRQKYIMPADEAAHIKEELGLGSADFRGSYACAPLQEGILLSQARHATASPISDSGDLKFQHVAGELSTEYPLSFHVTTSKDYFHGEIQYKSTSVLDSIASHIADAVSSAITAILDDLQTPTASLELARSLLQRWNLEAPLALEACVHEQFREVALAQPERPAIHSSDNDLTYEKLDDLSDRLARKLQQKGVRAEIIVPMLCEKSSVAVVCCLAIMKAGAALLPLDPSHPSERLAAIVHDCGALLAITTASCMNQVEKLCQTVLPIDMGYYERLPADHDVQSDSSTPSNACAVIYTSGSSGTPKGIHPILRTVFVQDGQEVLQVVLQEAPIEQVYLSPAVVTDHSGFSPTKYLPTFHIFASTKDEVVLEIRIHHALYNAFSMDVILQDISAAYAEQTLTPRPNYHSRVSHVRSLDTTSAINFWAKALQGSSMTSLTPAEPPTRCSAAESSIEITMPAHSLQIAEVTPANVFKAAWATVFPQAVKSNDIVFGEIQTVRPSTFPEIDSTCGPSVNDLPVRVKLEDHHTSASLAAQIQSHSLDATPHHHLDIRSRSIIRDCTPWPAWTRFSSMMILQNHGALQAERNVGGVMCQLERLSYNGDSADVWVVAMPDGVFPRTGTTTTS
ncbi:Nonribisomal peptide synthetase [Fulvia fulva]|nr:Nonribisomal peptide synthetase [Fulvia fulva]WPV18230.1 Nonribisomal peptide synthetase [Fulvia fulva]WPV33334.1 Nonribisomal peptide synthetase [Fulvia fulva]